MDNITFDTRNRILEWINKNSNDPFCLHDLTKAFPKVKQNNLSAYLTSFTRKGIIKKIGKKSCRKLSREHNHWILNNDIRKKWRIKQIVQRSNKDDLHEKIKRLENTNRALKTLLIDLINEL